jgi:hypothetical protein
MKESHKKGLANQLAPKSYASEAQAILLIGSNVTELHPVFGTMLRQAVLRRGAQLVVADPRRIDIAEFASLHLRHQPGTDTAVLNGIMHVILIHQWHDAGFITCRCEGFEEFATALEQYPPERVAGITGVPAEQLLQAAHIGIPGCYPVLKLVHCIVAPLHPPKTACNACNDEDPSSGPDTSALPRRPPRLHLMSPRHTSG